MGPEMTEVVGAGADAGGSVLALEPGAGDATAEGLAGATDGAELPHAPIRTVAPTQTSSRRPSGPIWQRYARAAAVDAKRPPRARSRSGRPVDRLSC